MSGTKVSSETIQQPVLRLTRPAFKECDISKAKVREAGDISSVFASLSHEANGLDLEKYASLKRDLVRNPERVKASWLRLKKALAQGIDFIKENGSHSIPQIEFSQLQELSLEQRRKILETGSLVVRNVIPRKEAEQLKTDVIDYIKENPQTVGFPRTQKVVYELYWSKSQIKARSHPNLTATLAFMNNLWHASPETEIDLAQNISYADRLRIRNAGDSQFSLGPHADGGSLERWEDSEYSNCYKAIFDGRWEEWDPYDATHRVEANMDLHESSGVCSAFRTFQGWLALSQIAPKEGTILFAPLVREVTAYYMLKPFFDENDDLKLDTVDFPGAPPGKGLEFNDNTHPELDLKSIMVPVPKVEAGDMVFWHCDLIHSVDPVHEGDHDSSVMYIPSTPLCRINAEYAFLQRESFFRGLSGPDFPGFPNSVAETGHSGRGVPEDVEVAGGRAAMQEFGLERLDLRDGCSKGARDIITKTNELLFF